MQPLLNIGCMALLVHKLENRTALNLLQHVYWMALVWQNKQLPKKTVNWSVPDAQVESQQVLAASISICFRRVRIALFCVGSCWELSLATSAISDRLRPSSMLDSFEQTGQLHRVLGPPGSLKDFWEKAVLTSG